MISSHWPQSIHIRRFCVTAEPRLEGAVWRLAVHVPCSCENPEETECKVTAQWRVHVCRTKPNVYSIKKFFLLEVLDVHILALLLTQAVFDQVFSLTCLAGEHSLSHAVGGGTVAPRHLSVHTVKTWPVTTVTEKVDIIQTQLPYDTVPSAKKYQFPMFRCQERLTYSGLEASLACRERALSLGTGGGGRGLDGL